MPVVEPVRAAVPAIVEEIVAAVGAENPAYGQVLTDPAGMGIRLGIEQALLTFLDAVEQGRPPSGATDEVWRRLGEAEFQAGRSLDALRSAFRTGTRAAWRAAAHVATRLELDTAAVVTLAEGIFVYSDALTADVTEGYLRMHSDEAGERERRRRRLTALLLDPDTEADVLERAAELAGWSMPRQVALLTVAGESAAAVTRSLDADVLPGSGPGGAWLVVPDPSGPGRAEALRRAVASADVTAALGPSVALARAASSLRWARLALSLVERGALPDERPTTVEAHLADVTLLADAELAGLLAERVLAPLAGLSAGERERLLGTLTSWLAHQRHTPAVAAALHVHPQTVRYRMARLRELLGGALEDPDGRLELELALRIAQLAGAGD